jgi:hypothetical protein
VEQVLATTDLQAPQCLQIFKQYLAKIAPNTDAIPDAVNNTLAQNILENKPEQILTQLFQNHPISDALEKQIARFPPQEFDRLSKLIEKSLINWWQENDSPEKLRHLFKLTSYKPSLISTSLEKELVLAVPVENIVASRLNEPKLYHIIQWELEQGDISRWREENALLANFAASHFDRFKVLVKKTLEKNLSSAWLNSCLAQLNQSQLPQVAAYLLSFPHKWQLLEHKNLPHPIKALYGNLKKVAPKPARLHQLLINAGNKIKPSNSQKDNLQKNLEIYIRLADLIVGDNPLVEQLWQENELTRLEPEALAYLFSVAQDYQAINQKIWKNGGLEKSTKILLKNNSWYNWFQTVELNKEQKHRVALSWLKCPIWKNWNNHWQPPEPTMEAWHGVINFLGDGLSSSDMQEIVGHWPKIVPFEDRQIADLCALVKELGAFITLAKAVEKPVQELKNQTRLPLIEKLSDELLDWLLERRDEFPELTFEQAQFIYKNYKTHKTEMALERTILLEPEKTLIEFFESDINSLFKTKVPFLEKLAKWINSRESINQIKGLDDWLKDADKPGNFFKPKMPFAFELVEQYPNIATFIYSTETIEEIYNQKIFDDVINALDENQTENECWDRLAQKVSQWHQMDKHPLLVLADRIRTFGSQREKLRENGWMTLKVVVKSKPVLLEFDGRSALPIVSVAANLYGNGSLGIATGEIIRAASHKNRINPDWWQALFYSVYHYNGVADRPSVALAYIKKTISLDKEEYRVFEQNFSVVSGMQRSGFPETTN